jgi:hypothetical protein
VKAQGKRGISELYASMLMVGVTLSFGGVIAIAAISQFNLSTYSGSLAAAGQQASLSKQISLVYGTVPTPGSGGCTTSYKGFTEGTGYTLALYNFGSVGFTHSEVFDNGTLLGGSYGSMPAGGMTPTR